MSNSISGFVAEVEYKFKQYLMETCLFKVNNNEIRRKIIDKIKKNKISTTEILDTLNKDFNYYLDVKPLIPGSYVVGVGYVVHVIEESNWWIHLDLIDVPENSIVLVRCYGENRAAFGSLVSKYLLLYRQCKAIICDGNLRDANELIKQKYPIWLKGCSSVSCFNKHDDIGEGRYEHLKSIIEEVIVVADDSGVALIPMSKHNKKYLEDLDWIEQQEDIWFIEIDNGKDTYEVVCKKTYFEDEKWMKKIKFIMKKP